MKIAILGAGLMGSALGRVWASHGHEILYSYARDMGRLRTLAEATGHGARAVTPREAVSQSDVVLVAVPWRALDELLAQAGPMAGKIVISCMLPMTPDDEELAIGLDTSGAEELARRTEGRVVGAFNTVWSDVIRRHVDAPPAAGEEPTMFYLGDDREAKATVATLIRVAGFAPLDVGDLRQARLLEPFGLLMGRLGAMIDPLVAYRLVQP
jgi:8-hydroxy-5-deazaflavin:NADPH oxidoreductase